MYVSTPKVHTALEEYLTYIFFSQQTTEQPVVTRHVSNTVTIRQYAVTTNPVSMSVKVYGSLNCAVNSSALNIIRFISSQHYCSSVIGQITSVLSRLPISVTERGKQDHRALGLATCRSV